MELVDLNDEEESDKEAISIVIARHKKTLRFLFSRYTNKCYKGRAQGFDSLRANSQLLSLGEFRKMLNDHALPQPVVSNEELATLFRLINNIHKKPDLQTLNFAAFVYAFAQLAIHLHNKYKRSEACIPLVEAVNALIKHFENAARKRGEATTIYTDPEAATLAKAEQKLVKELNAMVKRRPNYPLPEGFKKMQYKDVECTYELSAKFGVEESLKVAVEILDEVMAKALGTHFVEPKMVFGEKMKVVPDQMKMRNGVASVISQCPESVRSSQHKITQFDEGGRVRTGSLSALRPKVSVNTRLAVAMLPREMQQIGMEVGEVVEEVVRAVEEGRRSIGAAGEVGRLALGRRQAAMEVAARSEREREEKRKKRDAELKRKLKESKKAETQRVAEMLNNANNKNKVEKAKKKSKEEIEELKKRLDEKDEKRKERKLKLLEEMKAKEKEDRARRRKGTEAFFAKKKEELVLLPNIPRKDNSKPKKQYARKSSKKLKTSQKHSKSNTSESTRKSKTS